MKSQHRWHRLANKLIEENAKKNVVKCEYIVVVNELSHFEKRTWNKQFEFKYKKV